MRRSNSILSLRSRNSYRTRRWSRSWLSDRPCRRFCPGADRPDAEVAWSGSGGRVTHRRPPSARQSVPGGRGSVSYRAGRFGRWRRRSLSLAFVSSPATTFSPQPVVRQHSQVVRGGCGPANAAKGKASCSGFSEGRVCSWGFLPDEGVRSEGHDGTTRSLEVTVWFCISPWSSLGEIFVACVTRLVTRGGFFQKCGRRVPAGRGGRGIGGVGHVDRSPDVGLFFIHPAGPP